MWIECVCGVFWCSKIPEGVKIPPKREFSNKSLNKFLEEPGKYKAECDIPLRISIQNGTLFVGNRSFTNCGERNFQFMPFKEFHLQQKKLTNKQSSLVGKPFIFQFRVSLSVLSLFTKMGTTLINTFCPYDSSERTDVDQRPNLLVQPNFNHRNHIDKKRFDKIYEICYTESEDLNVLGMYFYPCKMKQSGDGPFTKMHPIDKDEWVKTFNLRPSKDKYVYQPVANYGEDNSAYLLGMPHAMPACKDDVDQLCKNLFGGQFWDCFSMEKDHRNLLDKLPPDVEVAFMFASTMELIDKRYNLATKKGWCSLFVNLAKGAFHGILDTNLFRCTRVLEDVILWCHIFMQAITPLNAAMLDGLCRVSAAKHALVGIRLGDPILSINQANLNVLGTPNSKVCIVVPQLGNNKGLDKLLRLYSSVIQTRSENLNKRGINTVLLSMVCDYKQDPLTASMIICNMEHYNIPKELAEELENSLNKLKPSNRDHQREINHYQTRKCLENLLSDINIQQFPVLQNIFGEDKKAIEESKRRILHYVLPHPDPDAKEGNFGTDCDNYDHNQQKKKSIRLIDPFGKLNLWNMTKDIPVRMFVVMIHFLKTYLYIHQETNNNISNMIQLLTEDGCVDPSITRQTVSANIGTKGLFYPTGVGTAPVLLEIYHFFDRSVPLPINEEVIMSMTMSMTDAEYEEKVEPYLDNSANFINGNLVKMKVRESHHRV